MELIKTTNVSKKNTFHPKIASKNRAIKDFLTLEIGIASFFHPKYTSLFVVFSILSLEKVSINSILKLSLNEPISLNIKFKNFKCAF